MEICIDSLVAETEILKYQLFTAEELGKRLQETLHLLISQLPSPGMACQIHKLTRYEDSEIWYGSIWDDSEENFVVASAPLPHAFLLQPLIKSEARNRGRRKFIRQCVQFPVLLQNW